MLFVSAQIRNWQYSGDEEFWETVEERLSFYLALYSAFGIWGYFQNLPFVNPMFWRSLLVFLGIHFFFVVTMQRDFVNAVQLDLARYLRTLIRAVCVGVAVYLLLWLGGLTPVRSFT